MVDRANSLTQFSDALVERSAAVNSAIAAVRLSGTRHITDKAWRPAVVITYEQSLPEREEFELETAGGSKIKAKLAGRDPGTNIAVLKLDQRLSASALVPVAARVGLLTIAFGADAGGHATARLGAVNSVGPEWYSSHGGRIEQKVVLDIELRSEE